MYDIDKNGKIDCKEMEKIIEAIYDLLGEENRKGDNSPPKRVQKIMTKLDKDQDGKLSPEEFIDGCLNDEILRHLLAPNVSRIQTIQLIHHKIIYKSFFLNGKKV